MEGAMLFRVRDAVAVTGAAGAQVPTDSRGVGSI
jgi:hypothetical protein